jgi:hypothetical protein
VNTTTRPLLGCTALLTLFALGCNEESRLTPPSVTTILVQPAPEGIAAPWTLTGPDGEATEGVGARTLLDLEPGDYTLTWGALESWRMPSPTITTKNLELDGSLTFKGVYEAAMLAPEGFVYVAPGTFIMGSPASEPGRSAHEVQHEVTLTRGFYIAEYEVTVQAWADVMGGPSSIWLLPITYVSWDMAVQFCNALSLREGLIPAYTNLGLNGNVT